MIQQKFAYTLRLLFARNENPFNMFATQAYKALYFILILIYINLCLWQRFFYEFEIAFPVLRRNKRMCF